MDNNNLDSVDSDGDTRAIALETSSPLVGLETNITCNHEPKVDRHEAAVVPTAVTTNTSLSAPIPNTISTTAATATAANDNCNINTDSDVIHSQNSLEKPAQPQPPTFISLPSSISSPSAAPSFQAASNYPSPSLSSPAFSSPSSPALEPILTSVTVTDHQDERESAQEDSSSPIKPSQHPSLLIPENDQSIDTLKEKGNFPSKASTTLSIDTTGLTAQDTSPLNLSTISQQSLPRANVEDDQSIQSPPSYSTAASPLNIQTLADSNAFLPSNASPSSSSSSSLSEYLIIGQEQVEKDDSECDHSCVSRDSYDEHYGSSTGEYSDASLDSHGEDTHPDHHQDEQSQARRRRNRHRTSYVRESEHEHEFSDGYNQGEFEQRPSTFVQQRITETAANESLLSDKSHKTKSHKKKRESTSPQDEAPAAPASLLSLPTLKVPSIRGISKSIIEFVVATAVCVTLMSCLFAFSYVSTGANHMLGWYSDQQIGQRIREGIKEREHKVQEALEKMAGEEYVKVKQRSRQYQQQQQQSSTYGYGNPYQKRYQQQYQQERAQRQQQRQQQEAEGLSTAEWQDLIRAASISFMARFSKPTPVRAAPRR
ncbi:hypothetical protein BGX27_011497 [Mortierella sp. AM989]|nr:hypothetical protein BGX27_011497 [Mortierella sp. AM989]